MRPQHLRRFTFNEQWQGDRHDSRPIFTCNFSLDEYCDTLFDLYGVPFPEQLSKAVTKRRAEFLAGRYCAQSCLNQLADLEMDIPIGVNRSPVWPRGFIGSISHCNQQAIAFVCSESDHLGVGIDIEDLVSNETMESIKKQIISSEESELISEGGQLCNMLFTLIFSAKESFFKAAYPTVKRYFDFFAVSLVGHDSQEKRLIFRVNQTLCEKLLPKNYLFSATYTQTSESRVITKVVLGK